jgi:hypothetical protein
MRADTVALVLVTAAWLYEAHRADKLEARLSEPELVDAHTEEDDGPVIELSGPSFNSFRDPAARLEVDVDQIVELAGDDDEHLGVAFPDGTWIGGRN